MRKKGTVLSFNKTKGFGFIKQDSNGEDLFFHREHLKTPSGKIKARQRVSFEVKQGDRGLLAKDVKYIILIKRR